MFSNFILKEMCSEESHGSSEHNFEHHRTRQWGRETLQILNTHLLFYALVAFLQYGHK
jgi:hypothetical protein